MKKFTLAAAGMMMLAASYGQSIPNGAFENWTNTTINNIDKWFNSNFESVPKIGIENTTKTTDKQNGTYAVKMETKIVGTDTLLAYVANGDPGNPEGQGVPYTQKPTTFNGWYKGTVMPGDSFIFWIQFKKAGAVVSDEIFKLGASKTTYTAFSFPLALSVVPDSVIVAAASSDVFTGIVKNGNTFYLDNISFGGPGITQVIPNGDFETWTVVNIEDPASWQTNNSNAVTEFGKVQAKKTTDKYKGNFAVELTTIYIDSNWVMSNITTGKWGDSTTIGGNPYNKQVDTLIGWYKYFPAGGGATNDTGSVSLEFKKNGSGFNWQGVDLPSASTYTYFEMPFNLSQVPDTLIVYISSTQNWPVSPSKDGSRLILDELQLKSQKLNTGITEAKKSSPFMLYPNPSATYVNIDFSLAAPGNTVLEITDVLGNKVFGKSYKGQQGNNQIKLDVSIFKLGIYLYRISAEGFSVTEKFVVE
jgi:hypothetical protein